MNNTIINPFITTGYAGNEYFCDRKKETEDIIRLLTNGNNIALISPRRYGKTNLIKHIFAQPQMADNYYTFLIDIYSSKSEADMIHRIGYSILETLKPKGRKTWEKFLSFLTSVQAGITFDITGTPSWTMSVGDINTPNTTLDEIFSFLEHADKPCIVAIDEFQQITHYNDNGRIEALLRTYIQHCNNTRFIFAGSQRHLMSQMFISPARPFYQSVALYNLPLIPKETYNDFATQLFLKRHKQIETEVIDNLYDTFDGITYYLQRTMNELFSLTNENSVCNTSMIQQAIDNIVLAAAPIYDDMMYQLPEKQSMVLYAIAKEEKAQKITSGKFIRKYGLLSPSSVKAAVPALIDKGLITSENGIYQIYDKFFQLWLKKNNLNALPL